MKRIETRLEQLESKAAAHAPARGQCTCQAKTTIKATLTADQLPPGDIIPRKHNPRINGICHRCGGRFSKEHPEPPQITIQPVSVN